MMEGTPAMPDFKSMVDKLKQAAGKHPEQVDKATDKAGQAAGERFGHEEQINQAGDKVDEYLTGGQGQGDGKQGQDGQQGQA
jgi:hypothetical protein